jgi:hypothetical protein
MTTRTEQQHPRVVDHCAEAERLAGELESWKKVLDYLPKKDRPKNRSLDSRPWSAPYTKEQKKFAYNVRCPYCGQGIYKSCRVTTGKGKGKTTDFHKDRMRSAEAHRVRTRPGSLRRDGQSPSIYDSEALKERGKSMQPALDRIMTIWLFALNERHHTAEGTKSRFGLSKAAEAPAR